MNYLVLKRLMDINISVLGLIILFPIMALVAAAIKLDSDGTILFKQKRLGKHKKEFYILKFRTMTTNTPDNVPTDQLQNSHMLITRVGAFLRKTSLDELPQLINIIKGDMSIIGPRPQLPNQIELTQLRDDVSAFDVCPRLTGLAQISGRDELSNDQKAWFDGQYVTNIGLKMDVVCFIRTIFKVISSDGVVEGKKNHK
ncbi:capsular biosynthesis protein [Erysipelothrix larvae]|uniref:Capsular biosynthesis protein n=1 Tax=Erysipelothrix larvae TaxID=1514105 RepID=A0A109UHR4_9FIRM|nr:sugar transferase [Erysipelothrix larvae]AMC94607.1 capsular biosynthesis protein [Erysipelothrix larvae]